MDRLLDGLEALGHWVLLSHPDLLARMPGPQNDPAPGGEHGLVYWPFLC